MTKAEYKSGIWSHKNTSVYPDGWDLGCFCEDLGENWLHHKGTALYYVRHNFSRFLWPLMIPTTITPDITAKWLFIPWLKEEPGMSCCACGVKEESETKINRNIAPWCNFSINENIFIYRISTTHIHKPELRHYLFNISSIHDLPVHVIYYIYIFMSYGYIINVQASTYL